MSYLIKCNDRWRVTKYLHEHEDSKTKKLYYTFYEGLDADLGKYEYTRDEVDEIYARYNWKDDREVKMVFVPREVKAIASQKRIINV